MDKQQSNRDNNIIITAIIIIESNIVVLYVCDLIALRGGAMRIGPDRSVRINRSGSIGPHRSVRIDRSGSIGVSESTLLLIDPLFRCCKQRLLTELLSSIAVAVDRSTTVVAAID